jgi:3-hydroxyisobutyrate dehydrogenase
MGYPMAGHLAAAGHDVTVFNRTTEVALRWVDEHGGCCANTPAEAATGADFVFVCVGGDDDVRAVTGGPDGALVSMAGGSVLVDHTTASADLARELAAAGATAGVGVLDAPISGGQAGAEAGTLAIMAGGDEHHFAAAEPVMAAYGATITLIGPTGSGQLTKMVNQILCTGAIVGAAEAIAFGERAGLDMERVLSVVTKGAAGSWYLSNRGPTMIRDEFDFGFAVEWMRKDLGICLAGGAATGADMPLTELADQLMSAAVERGDGRLDVTAVVRNYRSGISDR